MSEQDLVGGGPDAGLDAALGKAGPAVRSRRKLPTAEEAELFELVQAAGIGLDPEVFRTLLDLLRMNVAPLAVFQMLKSMCAGQRLAPSGAADTGPAALAPETRGRNKTNSSVSRTQGLPERCSREGSVQRMARQPSSSRLQKTGTSGKSSGGSST
ncbi:mitotic-spindle organizing protein 2B-like isoform X2 [Carettochelys insculpta]|uniref:mitotic-spindle organizing protein 2B-like isoform X2 n=1 Tax=Carettochelys insculpta TaxID=44489 RepID=UPI003EBA918E